MIGPGHDRSESGHRRLDYGDRHNEFPGEVYWVHIALGGTDYDRDIPAEERLRAALVWE